MHHIDQDLRLPDGNRNEPFPGHRERAIAGRGDRDVGRAGHPLATRCLIMELLEPVMDRAGRRKGPAPSTPEAGIDLASG